VDSPKVSICVITYNHERYLRRAIESILEQEIDISMEIIISDDCSTDHTREIIREYADKQPQLFRAILREQNVGPAKNFLELLQAATGNYIAYLEGDDYWNDPKKLKKQFDFLTINEEYVCCSHNAETLNQDGTLGLYNKNKIDKTLTRKELLTSLEIHTSSIFFRNCLVGMPNYVLNFPLDIIFYFYLSSHGKFFISKDIMSVYRFHAGGVWTGQSNLVKINKGFEIQNYILKNLPISKEESQAIKQIKINLKLNRLKTYANRFRFDLIYFRDAGSLIYAKIIGYTVKTKYLIFCLIPDNIINQINRVRSSTIKAN
jgi:glycosyltransferase involved in cell wall biosynthesis